jgi:hypothetical protein
MQPGGVELASGFDYSGIQPEQQWRLALYRVDVAGLRRRFRGDAR